MKERRPRTFSLEDELHVDSSLVVLSDCTALLLKVSQSMTKRAVTRLGALFGFLVDNNMTRQHCY